MESRDWMLWKVEFDVPGTTHKDAFFFIHVAAENAQMACQLAREWNDGIEGEPDLEIVSVKLVDTVLISPSVRRQKQLIPDPGRPGELMNG